MDDKDLPGKFVSDEDQRLAHTEAIARQIVTYYKTLTEGGLPTELAADMCLTINTMMWSKIVGVDLDMYGE
jgi:hypothetical protein